MERRFKTAFILALLVLTVACVSNGGDPITSTTSTSTSTTTTFSTTSSTTTTTSTSSTSTTTTSTTTTTTTTSTTTTSTTLSGPFLWKIQGDNPSYLFGTIHSPDTRVNTLPQAVVDAKNNSDALFTELTMDFETTIEVMLLSIREDDQPLEDILPPELYQRTDTVLQNAGLNIEMYSKLKIWTLSLIISTLDNQDELRDGQLHLDTYLYSMAVLDGKEVGGLETVEEQTSIFDSLTIDEQIALLEKTLDQLEEDARLGKNSQEELIEVYLSGNEDKLMGIIFNATQDPISKKLMSDLFEKRNKVMADRIAKLIEDNPDKSYFFAVGAGHYPGEEGIVQLLNNKGFTIERVHGPIEPKMPPVILKIPPSWPLVFYDTFDSNINEWGTGLRNNDYATGDISLKDGKYRIEATSKSEFVWFLPPEYEQVSDFNLIVDAQKIRGTEDAEYGVFARYDNLGNFYLFTISSDWNIDMWLWYNGAWERLRQGRGAYEGKQYSFKDGEINQINVVGEGSHFSFYINGQLVGEVDDDKVSEGWVGLLIGVRNAGEDAIFEFDNFELHTPLN